MRIGTVCTNFDLCSVFGCNVFIFSRTFFQTIQRTVTKQTVQILNPFVTRIIFAVFISKKTIRIFHDILPFSFLGNKARGNLRFPRAVFYTFYDSLFAVTAFITGCCSNLKQILFNRYYIIVDRLTAKMYFNITCREHFCYFFT